MLEDVKWWDLSTDNKTFLKLIRRPNMKGHGAKQFDVEATFIGSTGEGVFPPPGTKCMEFNGEITPEHHNQTLVFTINQERIVLVTITADGEGKFKVQEGTDRPVTMTDRGMVCIAEGTTYYTHLGDIPEDGDVYALVPPTSLLEAFETGDFDSLFEEAEALKKPHPKDEAIRELTTELSELDAVKVEAENLARKYAEVIRLHKTVCIRALRVVRFGLNLPIANLFIQRAVHRPDNKTVLGDDKVLSRTLSELMEETGITDNLD